MEGLNRLLAAAVVMGACGKGEKPSSPMEEWHENMRKDMVCSAPLDEVALIGNNDKFEVCTCVDNFHREEGDESPLDQVRLNARVAMVKLARETGLVVTDEHHDIDLLDGYRGLVCDRAVGNIRRAVKSVAAE